MEGEAPEKLLAVMHLDSEELDLLQGADQELEHVEEEERDNLCLPIQQHVVQLPAMLLAEQVFQ